ncbi:hypothetical protein C368_00650 [Cryptococcus neoformans 125.91]|nr:hypothetical protein C368_00650 [Cryptococcus neoformans var. grubii 125.91]
MNKIFQRPVVNPELIEEGPFMTLHAKCEKTWEDHRSGLLGGMEDNERKFIAENCSILGCKWLSITPYYPPLMFDNAFIFDQPPQPQAHPLLQPNHTICPAYHHPNRLDHEERYLGWHPHHHARHNGIVALLRSTLQALINGIVTLKPRTQEGQHRNDVRIRGMNRIGRTTIT